LTAYPPLIPDVETNLENREIYALTLLKLLLRIFQLFLLLLLLFFRLLLVFRSLIIVLVG
jgi:hypothetical protein